MTGLEGCVRGVYSFNNGLRNVSGKGAELASSADPCSPLKEAYE